MKINYSILWLDDNISDFIEDGWIININNYLMGEGFDPNIITVSKVDDFYSKLNGSFDLILTDYHMASKNGDEIVKEIRERNIQTEILFYTARADLKEISNIDRVTFVQTASNHQEEVVEETKELIGLTIKKFQHIIAMRGMIMHETSALDNQTTNILLSFFKSGKGKNDTLINSICDSLEKLLNEKKGIVDNIKKNTNFNKLIKDTFLFSAEYRIDALKDVVKILELVDFTDDYKKEVSVLRNKFAHAVLETDTEGRQYFKSGEDGITFNEDLCRTIRKDINKHKKNIDELGKNLEEFVKK